ncbi:MAG: alkane 1-monooxygenase [Pseudomonadota bacterium]
MRKFEKVIKEGMRLSSVFLPLITVAGLYTGGLWSFSGLFAVFGFYLIVEVFLASTGLGVDTTFHEEHEESEKKILSFLDLYGLKIFSLLHLMSLGLALALFSKTPFGIVWIGGILSLGIQAGSVGGFAGHEFMHSKNNFERLVGTIIYGAIYYAHFRISHIYGHHRNVGLESDWSTARSGESYYHFWYRAVVHGYLGAWELEKERLRRRKKSFLSYHNRALLYTGSQLLMVVAVIFLLNFQALLAHLLISLVAWSQIEAINYMSHYGLTRKKDTWGRPEKVSSKHSWESPNKSTNWFVFNAGKHSHHHTNQTAQFHELRIAHEDHYIPVGLPAMTIIALIPPLYYALMDPKVAQRR